jgi:hypothetical protein
MLYLRNNPVQKARELCNDIRLDRRPDAKTKTLYAALMAEAFARSGDPEEGRKLLETFGSEPGGEPEVQVMVLRAQVYTFTGLKKRGLAKRAMDGLLALEPNLLGTFLIKGASPEVSKLARQVLSESGMGPKVKIKRMQ